MSRNGLLGRLPLALYGLPNDRLTEVHNLVVLLGGDDGPAWSAYLKKVREGGLPEQPVQLSAPKSSVLTLFNPRIQLDAIASYNPSGFKTRPGLWVSDEFASRVVSKVKPVENLGAITLSSFGLAKNAYDKDIKADSNVPANHKFESESEFVAYLDQMISKQPEGEEGDLLSDGYWNIFYVAGYVVVVRWHSAYRRWRVRAWKLDDVNWLADDRVFARN